MADVGVERLVALVVQYKVTVAAAALPLGDSTFVAGVASYLLSAAAVYSSGGQQGAPGSEHLAGKASAGWTRTPEAEIEAEVCDTLA